MARTDRQVHRGALIEGGGRISNRVGAMWPQRTGGHKGSMVRGSDGTWHF